MQHLETAISEVTFHHLAREPAAIHHGGERVIGGRQVAQQGHGEGEALVSSIGSLHTYTQTHEIFDFFF